MRGESTANGGLAAEFMSRSVDFDNRIKAAINTRAPRPKTSLGRYLTPTTISPRQSAATNGSFL
ncbi:MAG: hypothetical protein V2I33_21570, partial [Kangiellaceae bacterium]|nr:hypothetical protein [Kangiellaceae bacterium]